MKLLITGSRKINGRMVSYAKRAVERAKELGWSIIVGDASGVDSIVVEQCDLIGVPVEAHGGWGKMRNQTKTGSNIIHDCSYPTRDLLMAQECDRCLAIWNGKSIGTKVTYDAVVALGKKADLNTFEVIP
jgi:hypothetical protein